MQPINSLPTLKTLAILSLLPLTTKASAAVWTYEWDATVSSPTDVGWTVVGTNPNTPQATGFIIPDNVYYTHSFPGDSDTGWTLQITARRVDDNAGFGALIAITDGSHTTDWNYFSQNYYRTSADSGLLYIVPPDSDNTQFVTIHITRLGNQVSVYYNHSDTPVASFTYTAASASTQIMLGDWSSGTQVSEIRSLNWTTEGAFLPSQVPEPHTLALLIPALGGIYALRRAQKRGSLPA